MNGSMLTITKCARYIGLLLVFLVAPAFAQEDAAALPKTLAGYTAQRAATPLEKPDVPLPDLSGYTHEAVLAKIPMLAPGSVKVAPVKTIQDDTIYFWESNAPRFAQMQKTEGPQVIIVNVGVYDLETLTLAVNDSKLLSTQGDGYILRAPLLIQPEATLHLSGRLRLSATSGAMIANAGALFATDAALTGWDETVQAPSVYTKPKTFRPFLVSWSGSSTYLSQSTFKHMGYKHAKSYGFTFSVSNHEKTDLPPLTTWLLNNTFEDIYYGFYSYEVDDVVIIGNTYKDNILYGIDPHDRSNRLIIAHNKTFGTKERHGIIISREVNDSFIIHNETWDNARSGIMIDRNSRGTVVAYNESYNNQSDGITIFESPDVTLFGNIIYGNKKNAIRVRNSWNVLSWDNEIRDNYSGYEVYADALESKTRDNEEDPYEQRADLTVIGGAHSNNEKGLFKMYNFDALRIQGIPPEAAGGGHFFRKELKPFNKGLENLLKGGGAAGLEFKAQPH